MFDRYEVECELTSDMLGTNSMDADIHRQHVIDKSRKLFLEKNKLMKEISKYEKALISEEKEKDEISGLLNNLESLMGKKIPEEIREEVLAGKLDALKETMAEVEGKGITVFFKNEEGKPYLGSHMVLGFLKAAADSIMLCKGATKAENKTFLSSKSYTVSVIDNHAKVDGMRINLDQDIRRTEAGTPEYLVRPLRAMTMQGPRVSIAKSEVIPSGTKFKFALKVLEGSPLKEDVLKKLFSLGEMVGLGQWRSAGYGQFRTLSINKI